MAVCGEAVGLQGHEPFVDSQRAGIGVAGSAGGWFRLNGVIESRIAHLGAIPSLAIEEAPRWRGFCCM